MESILEDTAILSFLMLMNVKGIFGIICTLFGMIAAI